MGVKKCCWMVLSMPSSSILCGKPTAHAGSNLQDCHKPLLHLHFALSNQTSFLQSTVHFACWWTFAYANTLMYTWKHCTPKTLPVDRYSFASFRSEQHYIFLIVHCYYDNASHTMCNASVNIVSISWIHSADAQDCRGSKKWSISFDTYDTVPWPYPYHRDHP